MSTKYYDIIITGGLGFIGKHMIEKIVEENKFLNPSMDILIIDKISYASDTKYLKDIQDKENIEYKMVDFMRSDICHLKSLPACRVIINFAADSHVDNSILSSRETVESNFMGVHNLLELVRERSQFDRPLFFQISTDEVYGDIREGRRSFEEDSLFPSSPYSASKAAAEHLIHAYGRTYDLEYIITRCTNNYGVGQFPEKLIPRAITCLKKGNFFPLHGDGSYIRNWIHVKDHVSAIWEILGAFLKDKTLLKGNNVFNLGGEVSKSNLEILNLISECDKSKRLKYNSVENRYGQDTRYCLDNSRFKNTFPNWEEKYPLSLETIKEIYNSKELF